MKKIDLGQTIGILANIGVIAGIIFLAVELAQNNELMEAEARLVAHQGNQQFAMSLVQNPALANVLAKVSAGEPLSDAEGIQAYALGLSVLRSFEFGYLETMRGALSEEDYSVEMMRIIYHANTLDYRLDETWEIAKRVMTPGFVSFFEENVVNRPIE